MIKEKFEKIKREIDLKEYARKHYGIISNKGGMARCPNPDHAPDSHPSFQFWVGNDGIQRYTDHHTGEIGTIIDFVMYMEKCPLNEAIKIIEKNEGLVTHLTEQTNENEYYIYWNLEGSSAYRKARGSDKNGHKPFWFEHIEKGKWVKGKGDHELIPYNLPESKRYKKAIICEGEKDAETIKRIVKELGLDSWVTSGPNGKSAWPDSLIKYFKGFEEVTFLYDVGAEEDAKRHAAKLEAVYPDMNIYIAKIPLIEEGADITDYLKQARELEK